MRRILIVTPTFNAEAYLDETILSVVSQVGDFDLHYHVQDGGSQDATCDILTKWQQRIAERQLPFGRVTFTFAVEKDSGMYDAINKGFSRLAPMSHDTMAWLGSDDVLNIGALATVSSIFDTLPEVDFIGGRHAHIDDRSIGRNINFVCAYSRELMQAGLYDGRAQPFVMQEGTFWRGGLWQQVGGLNRDLKLVGDWDLWRRFAEHAEFYSVDSLLAFHRRRPGQQSEAIEEYWREVDQILEADGFQMYTDARSLVEINTPAAFLGHVVSKTPQAWVVHRTSALPAGSSFINMTAKIVELESELKEARQFQRVLIGIPSKRAGELLCTCAKASRFVATKLSGLNSLLDAMERTGTAMQVRADFLKKSTDL